MSEKTTETLIEELDAVLAEEHAALLTGDLEKIANLLSEKEELVACLSETLSADSQKLEPVRTKLQHNQAMLEGAMEGIQSVIDRMAELRRVRAGLDTYDRSGQRKSYSAFGPVNLEKRA